MALLLLTNSSVIASVNKVKTSASAACNVSIQALCVVLLRYTTVDLKVLHYPPPVVEWSCNDVTLPVTVKYDLCLWSNVKFADAPNDPALLNCTCVSAPATLPATAVPISLQVPVSPVVRC